MLHQADRRFKRFFWARVPKRDVYRPLLILILAAVIFVAGCGPVDTVKRSYKNPYHPKIWTVAVVPFVDHSGFGSSEAMPEAVTDEFYAELQQVDGLHVMPVNRVKEAMFQLNMDKVANKTDVTALAETLDVDAVIVGSISAYDPYRPPRLGMIIELYDRQDWKFKDPLNTVDPGELAKSGRPFDLKPVDPINKGLRVVRVLDADNEKVVARIKEYARCYSDKGNPWDWEKYLTSRNYLRFVSHEIIGEMLAIQKGLLVGVSDGDN